MREGAVTRCVLNFKLSFLASFLSKQNGGECGRPDWHSQLHANFRPQSRGCALVTLGQLPLRSRRVKTPDLPVLVTAVAIMPYRGTLQVKSCQLKQLPTTSQPCAVNQVNIISRQEELSALDHYYGKTGPLSVLVLVAPVWITECPFILSVCLLSTICRSNNHSRHSTTSGKIVPHMLLLCYLWRTSDLVRLTWSLCIPAFQMSALMDIETLKEGQAEQLCLLCKLVTVLRPVYGGGGRDSPGTEDWGGAGGTLWERPKLGWFPQTVGVYYCC